MSKQPRFQPGPFRDTYGLGFLFPHQHSVGPLLRNRTIAAVSWDGDEAQFVNAAGLVVPCTPLLDLPTTLTRASRREYGTVVGDGLFAKPAHVLKAMEGAGTLRKWVTYHFEPGDLRFYCDDDTAWETHVQREVAPLDANFMRQAAEIERQLAQRQQRHRLAVDDFAASLPALPSPEELERRSQQRVAEERANLDRHRRALLEHDRRLSAWLRGELQMPPLLRGAA